MRGQGGLKTTKLEGQKRWRGAREEDRRLKGLLDSWNRRGKEREKEREREAKREECKSRERKSKGVRKGREEGRGDLIRSSNDPGAVLLSLSR